MLTGIIVFFTFIGGNSFAVETVKIASIHGFSGIASVSNRASYTGVRHGVEEINRRGGILGRPIELIELDNRSTPIGSKIAAKLAVEANVVAILGPSWSTHSIAAAKVAQNAGVPMIATDSTHENVTRVGDYIFRVCYTDPFQGRAMARFAVSELKAKTASVIVDTTSDYSIGLADVFSVSFKQLGGRIDKYVMYKYQQDNYRKEMDVLRQVESDILFIPGHDESAAIILEAAQAGIKGIPLGCDGWSTSDFFAKGGNKVSLAYFSTHWSEDVQTTKSQQFVKLYKNNQYALSSEPLGYDAVLLLADAAARATSLEPEKLKVALQETNAFQGVTGAVSFNEVGDPLKPMVVIKIDEGEAQFFNSISPETHENVETSTVVEKDQ